MVNRFQAARSVLEHKAHLETNGPAPDFPDGRFVIVCSCGYRSTNRRTKRLAVEAGMIHLRRVRDQLLANGGVPQGEAEARSGDTPVPMPESVAPTG
jgi:hypothetical protein